MAECACTVARHFCVIGTAMVIALTPLSARASRPYRGMEAMPWPADNGGLTPRQPSSDRDADTAVPSARIDAPQVDGGLLAVGVGFAENAVGSKQERGVVDALEQSVPRSPGYRVDMRRTRAGAGTAMQLCRRQVRDLLILVGYLPDRRDPVLLPYDCRLRRALPARSADAASDPALVDQLWREHRAAVQAGARERRQPRAMSRKAQAAVIAGTAVLVIGAAVAILFANALRRESVVITVGP